MGKILLRNIILNNQDSDILVSEGIIAKIAPAGVMDCDMTDVEVMDCEGKTAVPHQSYRNPTPLQERFSR